MHTRMAGILLGALCACDSNAVRVDSGRGDSGGLGDRRQGDIGMLSDSRSDASRKPDAAIVAPGTPRIFYSDLLSGPKAGGQDGKGAFVTIYGRGFGSSRGSSTVTVGGGAVDNYPIWSDRKVAFQLGAAVQTGDIVVSIPGKGSSNGVPFTVRSGNIYFVGPNGKDTNAGSFSSPWGTLVFAKRQLTPGDILYALDGATATTTEVGPSGGVQSALCLAARYGCGAQAGTASMPIALVAYPGATVTINCKSGCAANGIRIYASYWTVAGLNVVGGSDTYASALRVEAADGEQSYGQRVVANTVTSAYYGITAGQVTMGAKVLGNEISGTPYSAIYHGGYGASSDFEVAWNQVHDMANAGTFGIKAYGHTADDSITGLKIHDNIIHDTKGAAILVGGSDGGQPWIKDVTIYNNVIWNVQSSDGAIRIGNSGTNETDADVVIVQNTVHGSTYSLEIDFCKTARVQNNLFIQTSGKYISGTPGGTVTMDHNGYYGGSPTPPNDAAPKVGDPLFVNAATHDFHLRKGSIAIDAGVDTGVTLDSDGMPRQGAFDLGAFEYIP